MLLEAETNKYCPGGNDLGAISNLITWVLNFFLSEGWKKPGFFKKTPAQWVFLGFWVFWFFWFFFDIFAQKREFLGFFQFQKYF
jgi:hypothetical protein